MSCEHKDFVAVVVVHRLEDQKAFFAEIKIQCSHCDLPFEFIGVDEGQSGEGPMCALNSHFQELIVPVRPKGSKGFPNVPGFRISAN